MNSTIIRMTKFFSNQIRRLLNLQYCDHVHQDQDRPQDHHQDRPQDHQEQLLATAPVPAPVTVGIEATAPMVGMEATAPMVDMEAIALMVNMQATMDIVKMLTKIQDLK